MKMPFGRYRGHPLSALPADYFEWLCSLGDLREPLASAVEEEVRRRGSQGADHSTSCCACPDHSLVEELIGAGLHQLALRHHPDRGGSHEKMVLLNDCAAWLRQQLRGLSS